MAMSAVFRSSCKMAMCYRTAERFGCVRLLATGGFLDFKRFAMIQKSKRPYEWNKVVSDAEKIVGYPTSFMNLRCLLSDEIANVAMHMRKLVGTKHPLLKTARGLVYDGKYSLQARGLIILLLCKAAGFGEIKDGQEKLQDKAGGILPSQRSLAEITEMIHTANLIHKGVVNLSDLLPQDGPLKDMEFGNKMAVLSGDFLLASACTGLAELRNTQVVEVVSSVISELMEAEFSGLTDKNGMATVNDGITLEDWEHQTYLTSGSLLAKSCKSALHLANHTSEMQQQAFDFGLNMAYAHQLHDDLKPFLQPEESDNAINLLSAPVVCHIQSCKENGTFSSVLDDTDVINHSKVYAEVLAGPSISVCRERCVEYGSRATAALTGFKSSEAKAALINIIKAVTQL
ncbi:all trans-polyprenyl-diphosphate synthase PDSS2-like [Liolophura sinensis]|uniref:all trans-polyprenyl-diphosphate synthase PDSS2-like n=1 Tax=Liolophura sinensis TaxID=3198878 RepID=UPI00315869D9